MQNLLTDKIRRLESQGRQNTVTELNFQLFSISIPSNILL